MSSTDNRIVRMQFDNAQFKRGAAETQKSLADLDKATSATGKNKGLLEMDNQMNQVSLTASKMAVITTTALATITAKVVDTGLQMAKSLTFDPIRAGFLEYESLLTKQNTIMNATGKSAGEVKSVLNDLNRYSDLTIYSFADMTGAIQKFVNAGVDLPTSVTSIKGIANAAAFAGASSEEASRAMYAFSQSMSLGFIGLQDWNQIENANLGTIKFKEQLLEAAVAAGTLTRQGKGFVTQSGKFVTATEGWRDGLQEQWATTEVLNTALGKYADTSTKLGKQAQESAQEVRTFTAFMDTLKESIESGWAAIFSALIGNLKQATAFWTGFSNAIGNVVGAFFEFGETSLQTWRKMGGFEKTIEGIKNLLSPFGALIRAVGKAWAQAFPDSDKGVGKVLYSMSSGFELVTRPLRILANVIEGTTPIIAGFFQVIRILGNIIGNTIGFVADFVRHILDLAGLKIPDTSGFIGFIKKIASEVGAAIEKLDQLLEKGASIGSAFGAVDISLPSLPALPSTAGASDALKGAAGKAESGFGKLTAGVVNLKNDILDLNKAADATGDTTLLAGATLQTDSFTQFGASVRELANAAQTATPQMDGFGEKVSAAWEATKSFLGSLAEKFNFEDVVASFNLAVLSGMAISVTRFFNAMSKSFGGFGEVLEGAGGYLQSFQTAAKADLILNIGIALGILAASLFVLSTIPADKLGKSLAALTGAVLVMSLAMSRISSTVERLDGKGVNLKIIALSFAMAALGFSMLQLAIAFRIMNKVDWASVLKGLVTVFVLMKAMETLGNSTKASAKNILAGAAAIAIISGSMVLLAGALLLFKLINWEDLAKGGVALAGLSLAVGLLAIIPYQGIAKVGLALMAASFGVEAMARAMLIFGLVKWESIGKAAVALGLLTLALGALMIVGNPVSVGGMLSMAGAVLVLSVALLALNKVEWESIGKLAVVMLALIAAFAGFLAVISFFAPALILLSAFAGSLALLAVALTGLALAFAVIFPLLAVGTGAFAAFATGAAVALAVFVQTLAAEAPIIKKAFLDMLKVLIDGIVEAVPMIIDGIKRLWKAVKAEFTDSSKEKETGKAGQSWVASAANGIKARMPEIVKKASELLISFLKALTSKGAEIARAGVGLIVSVISGISSKIGDIVKAATDLIIKFAKGIGDGLARIVNAGIDLIGKFLHDLASAIRRSSGVIGGGLSDVLDAMKDVGVDIVKGLISGVTDMFGEAMDAIGNLAGGMVKKAKGILDIFSPSRVFRQIGKFLVQGLTIGIQENAASAIVAVASMLTGTIATANTLVDDYLQKLDQKTIAAQAKAEGLRKAAERARNLADKTKSKEDDKAAAKLTKRAKKAAQEAKQVARQQEKAEEKKQRQQEFEEASFAERAQIRSDDAQQQIAAAKKAEKDAEAARIQAAALERQAKAKGVTPEQRRKLEKEAERLRKQARRDAQRANRLLNQARTSAQEALENQRLAGEEAAKNYQEQYDAEAKADADAEAFEKLTAAQKAEQRRKESEDLQKLADANIAKAKELAFTDLNAANDLAALALEQAERARDLLNEAQDYESQGGSGQVIDLAPTLSAAQAFADYEALYQAAYAQAAGGGGVQFIQNNTSPEALSPAEIYRQTNNLVTYAADKLSPTAA